MNGKRERELSQVVLLIGVLALGAALRVEDHLGSIDFDDVKKIESINDLLKVGVKDREQFAAAHATIFADPQTVAVPAFKARHTGLW
jgi:hypothetical protein